MGKQEERIIAKPFLCCYSGAPEDLEILRLGEMGGAVGDKRPAPDEPEEGGGVA